jgi:peptidyl-prolyl cis-trans isomerase B (cyclophilin B)
VRRILILGAIFAGCGGNPAEPTPSATPAATDANGCIPAQPTAKDTKLKQPTAALDASKTYVATVETNCGSFAITLDVKRAPKTSASFKYLADQRFYDGSDIHRIVPDFVIQGGDPQLTGNGGPGYQIVEAPPRDMTYEPGVVAMAKGESDPPGASGSQFFVVTGPDAEKLPPQYALLGKLTGGEPVVQKIGSIITDPRTDAPEAPVVIKSVRVGAS